jgi:hypothetical protein
MASANQPKPSPRLQAVNVALILLIPLGCAAAAWFYMQEMRLSGDIAFCVAVASTIMRVATYVAANTSTEPFPEDEPLVSRPEVERGESSDRR